MKADSCYELGHVMKVHGIKGQVTVFLDVDDPGRYAGLDSVYLETDRKLVPYLIDEIQLLGNNAIIKFEGIDGIEEAKALVASKIFLPLKFLPDLGENDFYAHEIIGFTVFDKHSGKLGIIKTIYEANGSKVIGMEYRKKEVLIPLNRNLVERIEKKKKEIYMDLPEGLLEIYMEP